MMHDVYLGETEESQVAGDRQTTGDASKVDVDELAWVQRAMEVIGVGTEMPAVYTACHPSLRFTRRVISLIRTGARRLLRIFLWTQRKFTCTGRKEPNLHRPCSPACREHGPSAERP